MGSPIKIPQGTRFVRLVVIKENGRKWSQILWLCRCDCGTEVTTDSKSLRTGHTKSCGCLQREKSSAKGLHWMDKTPTYNSWQSMRARCLNKRGSSFKDYGGRGIKICERWTDFLLFLKDMGLRPPRTSLGRVDNNGDYEPSNCRWENSTQQGGNTRKTLWIEWRGDRKNLSEWCRELNINYHTSFNRFKKGFSLDDTFSKKKFKTGTKPK